MHVDGMIRKGIPKDACGWEDKERNKERGGEWTSSGISRDRTVRRGGTIVSCLEAQY